MLVLQQFACSLVGGSGGGSGWAEKGGGGGSCYHSLLLGKAFRLLTVTSTDAQETLHRHDQISQISQGPG